MREKCTGIVCTDRDRLRLRAYMSDVVITDDPAYEPGAVVPKRDLQPATLQDLEPFLATANTPSSGGVELFGFSKQFKDYVANNKDKQTLPTLCTPGELTTTRNSRNDDLRTGLHLDNKERLPIGERQESKRRIGFNMGPGARWLLLGSVDAFELTDALRRDSDHMPAADVQLYGPDYIPTTVAVREYAAKHLTGEQRLRCLWLRFGRGEGYLAPTETKIHDGSTYQMPDIQLDNQPEPSQIHFWVDDFEPGQFGSII